MLSLACYRLREGFVSLAHALLESENKVPGGTA
jgi:hypothetical protein